MEKAIQQHNYADILKRLHAKQQHPLIRQLDLFLLADGLLRCGGRLQHAAVPVSATHPVLLPQDNPYTTLVITDLHQKLQHVGTAHTLSQLRRNFYILRKVFFFLVGLRLLIHEDRRARLSVFSKNRPTSPASIRVPGCRLITRSWSVNCCNSHTVIRMRATKIRNGVQHVVHISVIYYS